MYNKELEIDSYINCLWSYFQSYLKSINKNIKYQEYRWLKVLEKSKLNLDKTLILKYLKDPNYIFKITKYNDSPINKIIILKLRFQICIYWLYYLLIKSNEKKDKSTGQTCINFNNMTLMNWTENIDNLISIFESRNEILIIERDKIYENIKELERARIKYPQLDPVHENKLENQLKALRYILNLEITDELRNLNRNLKKLGNDKFGCMTEVFDKINLLKDNLSKFTRLYDHMSEELLSKYTNPKIRIFKIENSKYLNFVSANLSYQRDLLMFREIIHNPKSLTFEILEKIKLIELKINRLEVTTINLLINKSNKLYNFILKLVNENSMSNIDGSDLNEYFEIQKVVFNDIKVLNSAKENNYNIISNLEKNFKYTDLKDLDLEFYYQFLTHINQLLIGIKKGQMVCIDDKKYLSNDNFNDKKKFNLLMKTINSQFVSKREFNDKIEEIESRISTIENGSNSPYVIGTMVISLISLSIWKKLMNFRESVL